MIKRLAIIPARGGSKRIKNKNIKIFCGRPIISYTLENVIKSINELEKLKTKLVTLTNIAKRKNRVIEIVDYEKPIKNVKIMTGLDKKRIGFKPDKGQNQWTRSCQNSGDNKKRRPLLVTDDKINELYQKGYKFNNKTNQYEKTIEIKEKGKKEGGDRE